MRALLRKKSTKLVLAIAVVALVAGLWVFEPWRAFTHSNLDESLPVVTASQPVEKPAPAPVELASGTFVSQEHETKGTARVLDVGGSRVLRLEGLSSSDGPDLHVWLTDAAAGGSWGKYDDGRVVKLGSLKATDGNQNYPIPADANLAGLRSVVIWCDRFNVAFGSAPLAL
ncbi:Electron transfer DM13 [Amycolatopsis xylanica]|uniref:Electron transfer DM13 n=1 Tax=Amycolatopsis xylanica TaxID=589385 RepID=A0A1H3B7X8_9PSEU|nr:DM13 domain-containing protein [Amycolatopsis xylanica]SDX37514.1 Electron transfer DM13 [Amycolatopsis xylanica]